MRVLKTSENTERCNSGRSRKAVTPLLITISFIIAFGARPAPAKGQYRLDLPISAERPQEDTWRVYQVGEIFRGSTVLAGTVDNEGHKWFVTDVGLTEFDGHSWRDYTPEPRGAYYHSVAADATGHVWTAPCGKYVGYGAGPLVEFDGYHWRDWSAEVGFCVTDIAVDGEGHMWFATIDGVTEFDGTTWRTYTEDDGLVNNIVYDIFIDAANHKWFGTYDGLSRFDGNTWTTYSTGDEMCDYISAVAIDAAGHIWIGSHHNGVSEFDGTTWHIYTTDNGLVSNEVRSIAVDGAGHVWVGTARGVNEFDGHTWQTYTTADGLQLAWVYCIFADDQGHLWFCTSDGVAELIRSGVEPPLEASPTPEGSPARVDLGFRPDPNGYRFANRQLWRNEEMFEQYFELANIARSDGNWCIAARAFYRDQYRGVANGWSCLGFSQTGLLSYLGWSQPNAGLFAIDHFERLYQQSESTQLTDSIAYYAGVQTGRQWSDEYRAWRDTTCTTTPDEMVESVRRGILNQEPIVVSLNTFTSMGWHTMAPYRVEEISANTIDVYVYDSETPGQERAIRFRDSNSGWQWTYTFVGSVGAAGTRTGGCADMYPYSLQTGLQQGTPPVSFCQPSGRAAGMSSPGANSSAQVLALVPAAGNAVVQDASGRRRAVRFRDSWRLRDPTSSRQCGFEISCSILACGRICCEGKWLVDGSG